MGSIIVYWYGQARIKISTGERVKSKFWNKTDHRVRETKQFDQAGNINTRLDDITTGIMNTARDHITKNGRVILDQLTEEFRTILKPGIIKTVKQYTFFSAIQEYIDSTNKKPGTITTYKTTKKILEDYQITVKKELSFDNIDLDFYDSFMNYMLTVKKYAPNTLGKYIKTIKVFMNYGLDRGYTQNRTHLHRKFHKPEETADTIYLNDNDLLTLYELDLKENKKLDRVRDLFLIGCYTGLRFSDLSQFTPDKFIKNGTQLRVKTIKTGETVVIPLHWTVKEILKKYNGGTPRPISNQKMNVYLKELCNVKHFQEIVILNKTEGGLSFEQKKQKWELVTVHTARRSFATNMYLAEVPAISIMKITGHRTEKAFMKYIKITQEQNADKLSIHPYFIKPLKAVKK
jgi:integrase